MKRRCIAILIVFAVALYARPVAIAALASGSTYCPWPGERLDLIAANAGVSTEAIMDYNGISTLEAGSLLRLPPGSTPPDQWTTPLPKRSLDWLMEGRSGIYLGYDNRQKRVALTFDIGYNPHNVDIMELLAQRGIHATFFVLGLSVYNHPEIVINILKNGHEMGALSWKHDDLTQMSTEQVRAEFVQTEKAIARASQYATSRPYFRAPFGKLNPMIRQVAAEQGYYLIGWTIDNQDWLDGATADTVYDAVTSRLCPGAIIVMHGYRPATWEALLKILDYLSANGYQAVSLSDLLRP
jgi:peptidoglycan/xylan/chitin deacetylase (PgdA/CDA1 family)